MLNLGQSLNRLRSLIKNYYELGIPISTHIPWSHAITVRLNQAYGEYQKERQVTGRLLDSWKNMTSRIK